MSPTDPIAMRLLGANVPFSLLGASFKYWMPRTDEERAHLETVQRFAKAPRGFLLMLGNVGTGKSHLAVATMRQRIEAGRSALLYRQPELLKDLRKFYDAEGPDPRDGCAAVDLLVLDETGLASGGKDELPLITEVIEQ